MSVYEACAAVTHLRMCTDEGIAMTGEGGGIVPQIQTRDPLMHKTAYPICKEFIGLLPKLLHCSLLHTARHECTFRALFNTHVGCLSTDRHGMHLVLNSLGDIGTGIVM